MVTDATSSFFARYVVCPAAVLAAAMLLLPGRCRAACYRRPGQTRFAALGPCNGCNGVLRVADGSQLSQSQLLVPIGPKDDCAHARHDAWPMSAGGGETGLRASGVGTPAGDRGRYTLQDNATITTIGHDHDARPPRRGTGSRSSRNELRRRAGGR